MQARKKSKVVLINRHSPTKRAPDAGDSAQISSSFTRLIIFLAGRLRRPCPSAGNANRWADTQLSSFRKKKVSSKLVFLQKRVSLSLYQ